MQPIQSARQDPKLTSGSRASTARLSSRYTRSEEDAADPTAQCGSLLITKSHSKLGTVTRAAPQSTAEQAVAPKEPQQAPQSARPHVTVEEPGPKDKEEAERKGRVHLWYQRLLHFRANPNSLEFSYLVLSNPSAVKYHPYDLVIVQHDQLVNQGTTFFYTMSADGVTQTNQNEVTHMSLDEFERGSVSIHFWLKTI
jgi:hypothetical protein